MSQTASQRPRRAFVVLFALAVTAVLAFAFWRLTDDEPAKRDATRSPSSSSSTASSTPTTEATTSPTPKPTVTAACEGPDSQFNVEGVEKQSLLPDCGVAQPVTNQEQQKSGLGLACGGSYPVILYKTTTTDAKTSICGKTSSGEEFHFVTEPRGGAVIDLPGAYDPQRDMFLAKKDGTSYAIQAYDGSLLVTKDRITTTQKSSDWISLDNESDFD